MPLRVVPIVSSLPLQRLLFFNALLSLAFGAAQLAQLALKLGWLGVSAPARIYIAVLAPAWCVLETLRLWLGFAGNLRERVRVPELSAFWMLTLLPQLPIVVWLGFVHFPDGARPFDVAIALPMIAILLAELWFAWRAVGAFIRKQTAEFYRLCQSEGSA